jgi:ribosomal protein S12 methylthiotransferase accessory factor
MDFGNIAAGFDHIYDPKLGIISNLRELGREPGAPDFVHVTARTCNPAALGGVPGPFTTAGAAAMREAAVARALRAAVARYCAALYDRSGLPLSTFAEAEFPCIEPGAFALFSDGQYRRPGFPYVPFGADTPVRWAGAVDLATGARVHVPAGFLWFPFAYLRSAGDLPVVPAMPAGLACGDTVASAALSGIYEVVARDSAALFWHSGTPPPQLHPDTLTPVLLDLARRFTASGDRITILDLTTNNRIPTYAAVARSERPEAPAFAFAVAANLDPAAALEDALAELAETRRLARLAQRRRPLPSPANEWEDVIEIADHLNFAAARENSERIAFILASDDRRRLGERENAATGSVEGDLAAAVGRIASSGGRVLAANLTSEDVAELGLAVCRVVIPGYQPLTTGHGLRALGGARLYEVPQKLGYRGIARGSAGNAAPHPFR